MFGTKKELLEIKTELDKIRNQLVIPKSNSEEISENEKELKKWETGKISDKEKLMAAYALNLCTVSVSQIVDYSDLVILEQEYEAILNNLNLENFPNMGKIPNELKSLQIGGYRELVVAPWRLFYRTTANSVIVLGIIDSRRDLDDAIWNRMMRLK